MAYICERCRRKNLRVMAVSHAKNRSHKTQRLNLHWARILVGGRIQRMRLCVKCIRTLKKGMKKKEEELKARMIAQQQALEEKEKAKREIKMEKKAVQQKVRKARSEVKRGLKAPLDFARGRQNLKPKTKK